MKNLSLLLILFLMTFCRNSKQSQTDQNIVRIEPIEKNLRISFGNTHLTTLNIEESFYKPFFWPVNTLNGITVTRGYPLKPFQGEPADHPHQTGIWFNFGDVNGIDFWNNSDAIPVEKKQNYGKIYTDSFHISENNSSNTELELFSSWRNNDGQVLINEKTKYSFEVFDSAWSITRNTYLLADTDVSLHDNKEGMFAIRLAREFQFDTGKSELIIEPDGSISSTRKILDEGKQGMYAASDGTKGNDTWGTLNEWVQITTFKDNDSVSVLIIDHPDNFGFPACWHARNYGLFSVNNIGRNAYRPELPVIHKDLRKGESLNFKHKIVIKNGGSFKKNELDKFLATFHSKS